MLVVSDASPLNVLVRISLINILPALYREIVIPPIVAAEMVDPAAPQVIRDFMQNPPGWLISRAPSQLLPLIGLDRGEQAAISLAKEIKADLLLVDEKRGRRAARELSLQVIGTIGVLEQAAVRGHIELRDALGLIRKTDFSVSDAILKAALERDLARKRLKS